MISPKFAIAAVVGVLGVTTSLAFAPQIRLTGHKQTNSFIKPLTNVQPKFVMQRFMVESDFASAMPEAPELTKREFLEQAADKTLASVKDSLGEGVEPVPALAELENVRNDSASSDEALAAAIYVLMIERGMTYNEDPDTLVLTPTDFDIPANLEVPQVKEEFAFLYKYGMQLIGSGYVSMEKVKDIVQERLIARTCLEPEAFDAWLGF